MLQSHAPSPTRLGLSNANSPQNPNPNPNLKPAPAAATIADAAPVTTSSALLSLLPPLPRAQSLLLQMAALAAKLFEVTPHRALWASARAGGPPLFLPGAQSQPLSFDSRHPSQPTSTKEVLSLFTSLQTQLFEAVAELQEILDLQDSKAKIAREVRAKDSALLAFTRKLHDAEQVLDRLLDDYSDYRRDPKRSRGEPGDPDYQSSLHSSLDLNEILAYAHRISYTTFAPPEHGAGLTPLRGALPPAPQDNEMRASQLYHLADLDVGIPKSATEGKEAAAKKITEALIEPTPPRDEASIPMPPMLPITVPTGWRKGMPVELPSELPPVPPGWKPGDPVPLPPLEGIALGNKGEEQRVGGIPLPPGSQPKAPEPIQVKYVQLDINPDQDEYSSDYSSEVGSSEEDEE
ncbi:Mediator of RNA polymerase II transcription subunit 4 [Apostasia shenzhenica]|uniref:Mediator of RNA polymerase II transcription subunit 4 n=1 Tax=Apostasia shenzhenica TaxID=1088818 RepID=A0A2I0BF03_9ASPA|nr:Mediator of RNA polymerase II transcription subunit 4 [Apostasia shenzhenica]